MQVIYSGDSDTHSPISLLLLGAMKGEGPRFRVLSDVVYTVPTAPAGLREFTVPGGDEGVGFEYDRATMPPITRAIVDRDMLDSAALAHDFALERLLSDQVSRKDCDLLFRAVANATPYLSDTERTLSYWAVRLGSLWAGLKRAVGLGGDTRHR